MCRSWPFGILIGSKNIPLILISVKACAGRGLSTTPAARISARTTTLLKAKRCFDTMRFMDDLLFWTTGWREIYTSRAYERRNGDLILHGEKNVQLKSEFSGG